VPHRHAGVDPHHADGCAREGGMTGPSRRPSAGRRHITRDTDGWARHSPRQNSEVDPGSTPLALSSTVLQARDAFQMPDVAPGRTTPSITRATVAGAMGCPSSRVT
jgi:hypothetical protein